MSHIIYIYHPQKPTAVAGAHAALPCRLDEPLVVLLQAEHADHDGGAAVSGGPLTVGSTAVLTADMRVE